MANVKNNAAAQDTKRRLIEAAGAVFAEVGFERATIKDITDRADASVAAVNYHFDDKRALYAQAVRLAFEPCAAMRDALDDPAIVNLPPEGRLGRTVHLMLQSMLADEGTCGEKWRCELMAREMQQPSDASDEVIRTTIRAVGQRVEAALAALFPPDAQPAHRQLVLLSNSVMAQCVFYAENESLLLRLHPDMPPPGDCVDELADHITRFTLAAVECTRKPG